VRYTGDRYAEVWVTADGDVADLGQVTVHSRVADGGSESRQASADDIDGPVAVDAEVSSTPWLASDCSRGQIPDSSRRTIR
jgi:hypothetical protein